MICTKPVFSVPREAWMLTIWWLTQRVRHRSHRKHSCQGSQRSSASSGCVDWYAGSVLDDVCCYYSDRWREACERTVDRRTYCSLIIIIIINSYYSIAIISIGERLKFQCKIHFHAHLKANKVSANQSQCPWI